MKRVLSTSFATICLILVGTIAVFWSRSLTKLDRIGFLARSDNLYCLSTHPHGISLGRQSNTRAARRDEPAAMIPKIGWSVSSHRLGSIDTFQGPAYSTTSATGIGGTVSGEYWQICHTWEPAPNHHFGFGWTVVPYIESGTRTSYENLDIPMWFVSLCAAAWPFYGISRRLYRRRTGRWVAAGLCQTCGYDLRASRARCPECGTAK